ncbi:MAG: HEPN domain-containing protein [Candidatus Rokubacteria bacterium]|nr:HEPN domain-containing protein [Candidatus Rokubacteria bacterium]
MPTQEQHFQQARHNEAFLATFDLARSPYLDWAVTAAFYAALHYLRALMAKHNYTNISRYADVNRAFERLLVLRRNPDINNAYRQLKDDSRAARYDMWKPNEAEVADLRDGELRTIREFVVENL